MSKSSALIYLEQNRDRFQNELIELLRIPSISHDSAYQADMEKAAQWLAHKLRSMGIKDVEIMPTAGHSVVYGEWLNGGASAPTIFVYGHYDVQSPEPLEDWKSPPVEPDIRNENLYARGASDMKGQTLASVNAVEAIITTENLPLNIKFLIEGEEEIGSEHLNDFLIGQREKLACDFSLNTDAGGMPDAETPSICYSLRGGAGFELRIFGPSQDIHSGEYGGSAIIHFILLSGNGIFLTSAIIFGFFSGLISTVIPFLTEPEHMYKTFSGSVTPNVLKAFGKKFIGNPPPSGKSV